MLTDAKFNIYLRTEKSVIFLSTDCDPMCQDEIFTL